MHVYVMSGKVCAQPARVKREHVSSLASMHPLSDMAVQIRLIEEPEIR